MDDQETLEPEAPGEHDACEARAAEFESKWKRALADCANREREFSRAREEQAKFATAALLRDLLPIADALDAASGSPPLQEGEQEGVGYGAIQNLLHNLLAHHGVQRIATDGMPDYTFHEVVGQRAEATADPGAIVEVVQQGYAMHGRCLRPARVIVAAEAQES